jgi:hypothetical protein
LARPRIAARALIYGERIEAETRQHRSDGRILAAVEPAW